MNLATKIIVLEIETLLEKAISISERYMKASNNLPTDLYTDIQYFVTRTKFIFTNTPKIDPDFLKTSNIFSNKYLSPEKSWIKELTNIEVGIIDITACLNTLKIELENNLLYNFTELIKAEVFDTHLESAKHLLDKGHKDAAAVIIGGVLEDKLRQLSTKHKLPLKDDKGRYFTIDPLNNNLCKAEVYSLQIKKEIIPLAEIRNNAAHGKYELYDAKQVANFYKYVLDFTL